MFWPLLSPHFPVMWPALPWKPNQGEVIWLPLGSRGRSLEAEIPHRPSLCSQVGCSNPSLSPPNNQHTKRQSHNSCFSMTLGPKVRLFLPLQGQKAPAQSRSMAPATWKRLVPFGKLGRKPMYAPRVPGGEPGGWQCPATRAGQAPPSRAKRDQSCWQNQLCFCVLC